MPLMKKSAEQTQGAKNKVPTAIMLLSRWETVMVLAIHLIHHINQMPIILIIASVAGTFTTFFLKCLL